MRPDLMSFTAGVDPRAIELHNRLNGALERGDTMEGLRLMREMNPGC